MITKVMYSIKEYLRGIFGSNYQGHKNTLRAFVIPLGILLFGINPEHTFIVAIGAPIFAAIVGIGIGYVYEKMDGQQAGNRYSSEDMRGNVDGAIQGALIAMIFTLGIVFVQGVL